MLNKKSIKTILNVKHTCIDNVKMLADSSIMIEVHATKGQQCWCGICGKKSKFYDNGNQGARTWRACDWSGHKVFLVAPSCRVNCPVHGVVTCKFPWARHDSRFTYKFEEMTAPVTNRDNGRSSCQWAVIVTKAPSLRPAYTQIQIIWLTAHPGFP